MGECAPKPLLRQSSNTSYHCVQAAEAVAEPPEHAAAVATACGVAGLSTAVVVHAQGRASEVLAAVVAGACGISWAVDQSNGSSCAARTAHGVAGWCRTKKGCFQF